MTRIVLILAVVLSTLSVNAAEVKFGLKLGVAFSKVENTNKITGQAATNRRFPFVEDNVTTFTGGISAKIDLIKGFGIDPEIVFQQVSGRIFRDVLNNGTSTASYSVRTISVPVMLRYRFNVPVVAPMIFTGPVVGVKLQSSYLYALKASTMQFDWRAGIGAMIKDIIEISVSYNYGLNNFTKYEESYSPFIIENRASYWTLCAAYFF